MNCHSLSFSNHYSKKRIATANNIIGASTVNKIIALSFYLLGASRKAISELTNIPYDTFKSFTQRIEQDGISTLLDRRFKYQLIPDMKVKADNKIQAYFQDGFLVIDLGEEKTTIKVPSKNTNQIKTVVLTMVENKLLDNQTVAELLGYAPIYIQRLSRKLKTNDIGILFDERQGQQKDYVFTPEIKAEVIQQFSANASVKTKTSSKALAKDIKTRCGLDLSPRTIRSHIEKLGLSKIRKTLPELIKSFKKNSKTW